jgi:hypothetical protein
MFDSIPWGVVYSLLKDSSGVFANRRLSNPERLKRRLELKPLFEARVVKTYREGLRKDVVIHDLARLDEYPTATRKRGISPSFRLGLVGITHRGILVYVGFFPQRLTSKNGCWQVFPHGRRIPDARPYRHDSLRRYRKGGLAWRRVFQFSAHLLSLCSRRAALRTAGLLQPGSTPSPGMRASLSGSCRVR